MLSCAQAGVLAFVLNVNIDAGADCRVIDTRKPIACAAGLMIGSHVVGAKVRAADGIVNFVGNGQFGVFGIWFVVPVDVDDFAIVVPICKIAIDRDDVQIDSIELEGGIEAVDVDPIGEGGDQIFVFDVDVQAQVHVVRLHQKRWCIVRLSTWKDEFSSPR